MIVKECPIDCTFDWVEFHKKLDIALAHMIEEEDGLLLKNTTLMDLVEYSFEKSNQLKKRKSQS